MNLLDIMSIFVTMNELNIYYPIHTSHTHTTHHNHSRDAPDWVSEILTGNAHRGSSHADDHGDFVVKLECPVVYVGLLQIEVVGEIREDGSHDVFCTFWFRSEVSTVWWE